MPYIKTIPPEKAAGVLKREYNAATQRAGRVWNIVQIMSLNPRTLHSSIRAYISIMKDPSGVTRAQREMLGTIVSQANECFY